MLSSEARGGSVRGYLLGFYMADLTLHVICLAYVYIFKLSTFLRNLGLLQTLSPNKITINSSMG